MQKGGSLITLTYGGASRVMPNYNVMGVAKAALEASVRYLAADLGKQGVRVNAISAGPMRTLAGSAVGDARLVFKWNKAHSPLKKNIELVRCPDAATAMRCFHASLAQLTLLLVAAMIDAAIAG